MGRLVLIALTLSTLIGMLGCGRATDGLNSATEEIAKSKPLSPEETLARLMELAHAGDWETYVDDFYGESEKFEGIAERRDAMVARFRNEWASQVVSGFEPLKGKTAEIVEGGKKAVFSVDGEPAFTLYLSEDGKWTFHL